MKFATILLLFVNFTLLVFGQQPGPRHNPADEIVNYALKNMQQEGDFYFLPFPHGFITYGFGNSYSAYNNEPGLRAENAQIVLRVLTRFEETRGVEVVTFHLERDQKGHVALPIFHGIFLKAKKRQGDSK